MSLTFRYSTMNAGKSIEVLKIAHNYDEQGKKVLAFLPKVSNRDGKGFIASRIGIRRKAIIIDKDMNMFDFVIETLKVKQIDCILIDECQFLSKENVEQLTMIVDILNIPVIAYGLKNDFKNNLFDGTKELLIYADKIEEIKTVCWYCNKKATMNLRINENNEPVVEGDTIQIGGNESYIPICRKCYNKKIGNERYLKYD